ncbi:MAG: PEP-CTERM sorting domain-containing protein [Candidatus Scalindua sp.]
MKRLVIVLSVAVLIFGITSIAGATLFEIGEANSIDDGLLTITYTLDSDLSDIFFSLNEGETSDPFDYAVINKIIVADAGDSYEITADLDFDLPLGVGIVKNEGSVDVTIKGHGMRRSNTATFDISFDPVSVGFGNDGWFTVTLSDATLGNGYCGNGMCGYSGSDLITATVTLDATPVPEPPTLLLLGSGLLGAASFRIRKRKKQD